MHSAQGERPRLSDDGWQADDELPIFVDGFHKPLTETPAARAAGARREVKHLPPTR